MPLPGGEPLRRMRTAADDSDAENARCRRLFGFSGFSDDVADASASGFEVGGGGTYGCAEAFERFFGACFDNLSARAPNGDDDNPPPPPPPKLFDVLPMEVRAGMLGVFWGVFEAEVVPIFERDSEAEGEVVLEVACGGLLLDECDELTLTFAGGAASRLLVLLLLELCGGDDAGNEDSVEVAAEFECCCLAGVAVRRFAGDLGKRAIPTGSDLRSSCPSDMLTSA